MSGEHDTDSILWLLLEAISCVAWLIYRSHRWRGHGSNFLTAVIYSSQSNSKLYVQKNNYVPKPPVEPAQWWLCEHENYSSWITLFCWFTPLHIQCSINHGIWLIISYVYKDYLERFIKWEHANIIHNISQSFAYKQNPAIIYAS